MTGTPKKVFWAFVITGYIIGLIIGLRIIYSPDNYTMSKVCTDYEGVQRYDPNYGDGSCNQYGYEKGRENLLVPIIIYGGAGAFVAGWIGLFVATGVENHESKKGKG